MSTVIRVKYSNCASVIIYRLILKVLEQRVSDGRINNVNDTSDKMLIIDWHSYVIVILIKKEHTLYNVHHKLNL